MLPYHAYHSLVLLFHFYYVLRLSMLIHLVLDHSFPQLCSSTLLHELNTNYLSSEVDECLRLSSSYKQFSNRHFYTCIFVSHRKDSLRDYIYKRIIVAS